MPFRIPVGLETMDRGFGYPSGHLNRILVRRFHVYREISAQSLDFRIIDTYGKYRLVASRSRSRQPREGGIALFHISPSLKVPRIIIAIGPSVKRIHYGVIVLIERGIASLSLHLGVSQRETVGYDAFIESDPSFHSQTLGRVIKPIVPVNCTCGGVVLIWPFVLAADSPGIPASARKLDTSDVDAILKDAGAGITAEAAAYSTDIARSGHITPVHVIPYGGALS